MKILLITALLGLSAAGCASKPFAEELARQIKTDEGADAAQCRVIIHDISFDDGPVALVQADTKCYAGGGEHIITGNTYLFRKYGREWILESKLKESSWKRAQ